VACGQAQAHVARPVAPGQYDSMREMYRDAAAEN
jgi:hypothetical protein